MTGTIVTGSNPPQQVNPTAVVNVNYPAIADTTVSLALVGQQNVASIQPTAVIPRGQSSVTVPIAVTGNPGPQTLTFTITATLAVAAGSVSAQSNTFTVTGLVVLT